MKTSPKVIHITKATSLCKLSKTAKTVVHSS